MATSTMKRHIVSSYTEDTMAMTQVQETHLPDGYTFPVKPMIQIAEHVFGHGDTLFSTEVSAIPGFNASVEVAFTNALAGMFEPISLLISKISCEICCKCGNTDAHGTALAVLNLLGGYAWEAKVAISLAALAVIYGEFTLVVGQRMTSPLAKTIAMLKQLPTTPEGAVVIQHKVAALNRVIKAIINLLGSIVEITNLPTQYISTDTEAMVNATKLVPFAAYWAIRSIIACANQITVPSGVEFEFISSTTETWELLSLEHKVINVHTHVTQQLTTCIQHIETRREEESYNTIVNLFQTQHEDNLKVLTALLNPKLHELPLYNCSTNIKASINELSRKTVLLLITDVDISIDYLRVIEDKIAQIDRTVASGQYAVVWVPVSTLYPWTSESITRFMDLQKRITWYTLYNHSSIHPTRTKFFKQVWHFNKKPILVVISPQGAVVNVNAIPMLYTWGASAYPFSTSTEETLHKSANWSVQLFTGTIEPRVNIWVRGFSFLLFPIKHEAHQVGDEKYVCIYGGDDSEWVRRFTASAAATARAARINLEMLYVGKSKATEKMKAVHDVIMRQKMSDVLYDHHQIEHFWERLESIWHTKTKHDADPTTDDVMREIMTILSYDGSGHGWAIIWKGSEYARGRGDAILQCMDDSRTWLAEVDQVGFVGAVKAYLARNHTAKHCNHLILPSHSRNIPDFITCVDCGRRMEKLVMYRCCNE